MLSGKWESSIITLMLKERTAADVTPAMSARALFAQIAAVNVWAEILFRAVNEKMKKTGKITLCAVMAALSAVFMLFGLFPYLTYAVPAVSGLFIAVVLIETDYKFAVSDYIISSAIIVFYPDNESKLLYICFLGFYPIIKALAEKIRSFFLEWAVKLAVFNAGAYVYYLLLTKLFGVSFNDVGSFMKWGLAIFWIAANGVFIIYDIAFSRLSGVYMMKIHPKIKKIFK